MKTRPKTSEELQTQQNLLDIDLNLWIMDSDYDPNDRINYSEYLAFLRESKNLNKQRISESLQWNILLRICKSQAIFDAFADTKLTNAILEFGNIKIYIWKHCWLYDPDNKIKSLKIILYDKLLTQELQLPEEDLQRLLNYLIEGGGDELFDCESFVHYIKWVDMNHRVLAHYLFPKKRNISHYATQNLQVWDCIWISKAPINAQTQDKYISHFAYYIWENLFLSKFWTWGNLRICSLKEMYNSYDCKHATIMRPNPEYTNTDNDPKFAADIYFDIFW